jgi:diguanylate cyclase (GGDEF)-like protein
MLETLKHKFQMAVNFPSPPAIAMQIIELTSEPDIDMGKVAAAIAKDPGLTAKVLRVANSPLYSKRRKSENLRQALITLGINAATTLALGFSLVARYKSGNGAGIDYARFWRRAILSASAARTFGAIQSARALEGIFLAAILQDIAMLAIDRVQPDFYNRVPPHASHEQLVAHEMGLLGTDHASIGAWLMRNWKLPESLCTLVAASHEPTAVTDGTPAGVAARCVALGSECVEVLLAPQAPKCLDALATHAETWLGIHATALAEAMATIVAEIPETERLFDTALIDTAAAASILDQARELLTFRTIQAFEQVETLKENSEHLEARTTELEDKHRRDPLTGVFNRGHLDEVLAKEFQGAVAGGWPLSVVFADLDRFKLVNDTYGHQAGDTVLIATAKVLLEVTRDTDCVGRYGGEEFVIVLPGLGADAAQRVCERLLARLRDTQHVVAGGMIRATASLGLATHSTSTPFTSAAKMIEAADRSVYAAKAKGRDRLVCFDPRMAAKTA